ncbi:MAG: ADP-dependent NAD(P)H-hydrate dehydratase / NAD(P)H-hydrate epimerase [Actinomycetota bacterium]|nr:ADP-dependent NAD(P)H-hydrate dehydratase / NAD(P)H-hydrate epimerase [Actinomycetota bacterium]
MQPVLTPAEMAEADRRTIAGGTAESVLVERAGAAVARHALRMLGGAYGRRVVVVCGKGNNGADGGVAAHRLRARGVGVDEFALAGGIDEPEFHRALRRSHLAVDAMFGTGFRGALDGEGAEVARAFAAASIPTLAVDIPSGIDGLTGEARGAVVRARQTVTFAALKPGVLFEPGRSRAGRVHVVDIGIDVDSVPRRAQLYVLEVGDLVLPRRTPDGHKWSTAVFVIGGSPGMTGAPLLAGHAAARSGAGMVVCGVPGIAAANRAGGSELVIRALPASSEGHLDTDAAAAVLDGVDRFRGIAIGPGLGRDQATQEAVRRIVAECPIPIVVDADGLNALAHDPGALHARRASGFAPAILTPHGGEFERLAGAPVGPDRVAAARDLAARLESIVLLKGPGTVIADPDGRAVVNRTDGPALAAAGTGDVLTGVISGLLAGGASPFDAAATGAHVHGRAAVEAGTGDELTATDLIGALHPTLDILRSGRDPREA